MRKFNSVVLLLILTVGLAAAAEFGYPAAGESWYSIKVRFEAAPAVLGSGTWTLVRVAVDGKRARDFALFQGGKETPGHDIDAAKPFDLKVRWSWEARRTYEIKAEFEAAGGRGVKTLTTREKAPAVKGYWNAAWKSYLSLLVSEDDG
ncbi:MAG: hypothetical protein PHI34_12340, partial [Acidobacteriota bacterium]|nr:hypothetical protein [Acidobacteriota bacterium]